MVNLLAPRAVGQSRHWNDQLTYVDLQYTFIANLTGQPLSLARTLVSFYDFDAGRNIGANGARVAKIVC